MDERDRQCLVDLRATDLRDDKKRIEETKGGLFQDSYRWILKNDAFQRWRDDQQSRLLWIKGDPGKGKMMLLCGIIDELEKSTAETGLLPYFFCQGTESRINNTTAVLRGLIYLLVKKQPLLISHLRKKYDQRDKEPFEGVNACFALSEIFTNILQDPSLKSTYLIVDALDECVTNAKDKFLWVALVCQNLEKSSRLNTLAMLNTFPPGLDPLYERMIRLICSSDIVHLCKQILAFMASIYRPITLNELTSFAELPDGARNDLQSWTEVIGLCGSFLTIRDGTVYFVHQSAKVFLLEKASNEIFPSGMEKVHYAIFSRSLEVMSMTLRRDIYSLGAPGFSIDNVKQPNLDPLATVRYSCVFWVGHLHDWHSSESAKHLDDLEDSGVDKFLRKKYICWLEALSLLRSMSEGVLSMAKLEGLLQVSLKSVVLFYY